MKEVINYIYEIYNSEFEYKDGKFIFELIKNRNGYKVSLGKNSLEIIDEWSYDGNIPDTKFNDLFHFFTQVKFRDVKGIFGTKSESYEKSHLNTTQPLTFEQVYNLFMKAHQVKEEEYRKKIMQFRDDNSFSLHFSETIKCEEKSEKEIEFDKIKEQFFKYLTLENGGEIIEEVKFENGVAIRKYTATFTAQKVDLYSKEMLD